MANKNTNKNVGTNYVTVTGKVESDFEFSHKSGNKSFYMTKIAVKRLSDVEDHIQLIVPEKLIDTAEDYVGKCVRVRGNYRSYNNRGEQKNRVLLAVFAKGITFTDEEPDAKKSNRVHLDGYICKTPVYRKTPKGREITDLFIAVNRPFRHSDYIPCICWGNNAVIASEYKVGDRVNILGRIQSREYTKQISETESEKRVAYEVSINSMRKEEAEQPEECEKAGEVAE